MMSITKSLNKSEAEYIVHHLVLPPQLPQEDDWTQRHCDCILQFVDQVFSDYSNHEENATHEFLVPIREMVHRVTEVMPGGVLNADACADTLEKLSIGGKADCLMTKCTSLISSQTRSLSIYANRMQDLF
jgi:hypothetical protein